MVSARAGGRTLLRRGGTEAGTQQLLLDLPKARWAHLATHGFFADAGFRSALQLPPDAFLRLNRGTAMTYGARNPLVLSGVVLAGANLPARKGGDEQDDRGILTAEAIASLPLDQLELVVLSACQTARGEEVGGGEGVFGLQRAFHLAGTRTAVASLWKVPDHETHLLMSRFYENLWQKNMGPSEAMRHAQLSFLKASSTGGKARSFEQIDAEPGQQTQTLPWLAAVTTIRPSPQPRS